MNLWIPVNADTEKIQKNINSWMQVTTEYPYLHKIQDRVNSMYPRLGTKKILYIVEINNNNIIIPKKNISKNMCSICLLEDNECFETLACNHEFHLKCINKWFKTKNTCPMCRNICF